MSPWPSELVTSDYSLPEEYQVSMANRLNRTTKQSVSTSVSPNVAVSLLTASSSSSRSRSVSLLQKSPCVEYVCTGVTPAAGVCEYYTSMSKGNHVSMSIIWFWIWCRIWIRVQIICICLSSPLNSSHYQFWPIGLSCKYELNVFSIKYANK